LDEESASDTAHAASVLNGNAEDGEAENQRSSSTHCKGQDAQMWDLLWNCFLAVSNDFFTPGFGQKVFEAYCKKVSD
jgi:hypothetical protein